MSKIERESNWGYWDTLDGVRLKDGEKLRIVFPDGVERTEVIRIEHGSFAYSDHGHEYTGPNDRAYVMIEHFGLKLPIYLAGLQAERA